MVAMPQLISLLSLCSSAYLQPASLRIRPHTTLVQKYTTYTTSPIFPDLYPHFWVLWFCGYPREEKTSRTNMFSKE
jgi:hypothetical protein